MITLSKAERPLAGTLQVPGDKSISHRSIMLGALSKGTTEITGFLESADCLATINCFRAMGVEITHTAGEDVLLVNGRVLYSLKAPADTLFTANSGTTTRIISGILAAQAFRSRLAGDDSLNTRPMKRIITPLQEMGAHIESENGDDCCPLLINGSRLHAVSYQSPIASAQVKSCLLLAGLYADGVTVIREPHLSRNHTELMLQMFGADIITQFESDNDKRKPDDFDGVRSLQEALHFFGDVNTGKPVITLTPGRVLHGQKINVPGDISSAAFFIAAALLIKDSDVVLKNVGINPTRAGFIKVLQELGANIEIIPKASISTSMSGENMEPACDLHIRYSELACPGGTLNISGNIIPTLIDELPLLAIVAAFANGQTIIKDAAELRVKESDRIDLITRNLLSMGADIAATDDGFIINGGKSLHAPADNAPIVTGGDHRIAMGFAVAALAVNGNTVIDDSSCISVSYPTFFKDLTSLS